MAMEEGSISSTGVGAWATGVGIPVDVEVGDGVGVTIVGLGVGPGLEGSSDVEKLTTKAVIIAPTTVVAIAKVRLTNRCVEVREWREGPGE